MKKFTDEDAKRIFDCGRNYQLTGENNFKEVLDSINAGKQDKALFIEVTTPPNGFRQEFIFDNVPVAMEQLGFWTVVKELAERNLDKMMGKGGSTVVTTMS